MHYPCCTEYAHLPRRAMTSERSSREDVVMSHLVEDDELADIEQRAARTFAVAPTAASLALSRG
jgi:hypothetical protein